MGNEWLRAAPGDAYELRGDPISLLWEIQRLREGAYDWEIAAVHMYSPREEWKARDRARRMNRRAAFLLKVLNCEPVAIFTEHPAVHVRIKIDP